MPFRAGQSGNPQGRRKGSQNRVTRLVSDLVTPAAPTIVKDIIARAKTGDPFAQRAYLSLLPQSRYVDGPVDLPHVKNAHEALDQIAAIGVKAAKGEVDLDGARFLIETVLKNFISGYAVVVLEAEVEKTKLHDKEGESG
jgi:hypothetical protein